MAHRCELLAVAPETATVTAFRVTREGCELVVNDISGKPGNVSWRAPLAAEEREAPLGAYGIATLRP